MNIMWRHEDKKNILCVFFFVTNLFSYAYIRYLQIFWSTLYALPLQHSLHNRLFIYKLFC
jgi:hypothetical protein